MNLDASFLDRLTRQLWDLLPGNRGTTPAPELRRALRALLEAELARLDLVSREEFEVQRAVLQKTRARLQELEARLADLENRATTTHEQGD